MKEKFSSKYPEKYDDDSEPGTIIQKINRKNFHFQIIRSAHNSNSNRIVYEFTFFLSIKSSKNSDPSQWRWYISMTFRNNFTCVLETVFFVLIHRGPVSSFVARAVHGCRCLPQFSLEKWKFAEHVEGIPSRVPSLVSTVTLPRLFRRHTTRRRLIDRANCWFRPERRLRFRILRATNYADSVNRSTESYVGWGQGLGQGIRASRRLTFAPR